MTTDKAFKKAARDLAAREGIPYAEARTRIRAAEQLRHDALAFLDRLGADPIPLATTGDFFDPLRTTPTPQPIWTWWGRLSNPEMLTVIGQHPAGLGPTWLADTPVGRWRIHGTANPGTPGVGEVYLLDDHSTPLHDLPHRSHHSPAGFGWGYRGSGAADLARSVLAYVFPDPTEVEADNHDGVSALVAANYQDFKDQVIANLPEDEWDLSIADIENWMHKRRLSLQPERREDGVLPYEWHLYPGGLLGQQDLYKGDPAGAIEVSHGPEDYRGITTSALFSDPAQAIGRTLVGGYEHDETGEWRMAGYSTPIAHVTHEPKRVTHINWH